jgi:hypothetical protein
MDDSIDDGDGKAEPAGGGFITDLAVFGGDMRSNDFSAVFQVNGIGGQTAGNARGQAQNGDESNEMRCRGPHTPILSRRPQSIRNWFLPNAQSGYSGGLHTRFTVRQL